MAITFKMIIKTKITCPAQINENEVSVIIFQKKNLEKIILDDFFNYKLQCFRKICWHLKSKNVTSCLVVFCSI